MIDNQGVSQAVQELLDELWQEEIIESIRRYVEEYHWRWGIIRSCINRQYGTDYTLSETTAFYRCP